MSPSDSPPPVHLETNGHEDQGEVALFIVRVAVGSNTYAIGEASCDYRWPSEPWTATVDPEFAPPHGIECRSPNRHALCGDLSRALPENIAELAVAPSPPAPSHGVVAPFLEPGQQAWLRGDPSLLHGEEGRVYNVGLASYSVMVGDPLEEATHRVHGTYPVAQLEETLAAIAQANAEWLPSLVSGQRAVAHERPTQNLDPRRVGEATDVVIEASASISVERNDGEDQRAYESRVRKTEAAHGARTLAVFSPNQRLEAMGVVAHLNDEPIPTPAQVRNGPLLAGNGGKLLGAMGSVHGPLLPYSMIAYLASAERAAVAQVPREQASISR